MQNSSYQDRLVQLGREFEKLVFTKDVPRGAWQDFTVRYKGEEVFQGVLAENIDVVVKDVGKVQDATEILVSVRSSAVGKQQKFMTVYFDPMEPFYIKSEGSLVSPNLRKLKQQVQFVIQGTSNFDKEELNVGEVKGGSIVDFEFNYIGEREIGGVKGTCGCTNVSLNGNKITGQIDTTGFEEDWSKHVNVYIGDYKNYYYSKNGVLRLNPDCAIIPLIIKGKIKK